MTKFLRNMEMLEKQNFTCELFDFLHVYGP